MVTATHVGGPTLLLEVDGWRILTDPTFDEPGETYRFGWGTSSRKTGNAALDPDEVGPVDLVLLSHDHHADNLDTSGRALLARAPRVLTTRAGARRLGGGSVRGLRAGDVDRLEHPERPELQVRATPCRHGPPLSRPVAGPVIGFESRTGDRPGSIWVTGDTVLTRRLRRTATTVDADVLVVHLGRVRFPVTGPLRYSMDGDDAAALVRLARPRVVVPVHYEGWSHFSEPVQHARTSLVQGTSGTDSTIEWLDPGVATPL